MPPSLIDAGVAVHSMSPRSVHDVGGEVRALAARLEVAVPFPFGGDDWDGWLATVLTPRWYDAFVAVWRRPWMSLASDTYGASLLDVLGVGNVFADSFDRYPEVTLEEVAARAPNLVILPSEPYEFGPEHAPGDRARGERRADRVRRRPRPLLVGDPHAGGGSSDRGRR